MKKIILSSYYFLITATSALAQGPTQSGGSFKSDPFSLELDNPLGTTSIIDLLNRLIFILTFYIAAPVAVFMIIVGAFQMLSSGGDVDKFATGRKTVMYVAIGFGVLLLANFLIDLIAEILGVDPSLLPGR